MCFRKLFLCLLGCILLYPSMIMSQGQLTRSQVLGLIVAGNKARNSGDIETAIEKYKTVIDNYPNYALPYKLTAQIYEDKEDSASIATAMVLYRKYVQLELNDENREEAAAILAQLENKLDAPHFEEYSDSTQFKSEEVATLENVLQDDEEETPSEELNISNEAREAENVMTQEKKLQKNYVLSLTVPERTPSHVIAELDHFSEDYLNGRWASSQKMPNGKEAWILDIRMSGNGPRVELLSCSGLSSTKSEKLMSGLENVSSIYYAYRTMSNKIKLDYSAPSEDDIITGYSVQTIPLMTRTVDGKIENGKQLSFTFQGQYEHQGNSSKWDTFSGYLKGAVNLLPIVGSWLGDMLESGISWAVSQDKDYSTQSQIRFQLHPTSIGMLGEMRENTKTTVKDEVPREFNVDRHYGFYKVDDEYTGFEPMKKSVEQLMEENEAKERIKQIENKADRLYCQGIANCYDLGNTKISDYNPLEEGMKHIKKAADAGHKEAKKILAELYYKYTVMDGMSAKKGSVYKKLADAIITKLIENEYTEGKMLQANCMYKYGRLKNPEQGDAALNIYRELEEKDYLPAIVSLGSIQAVSDNEKIQQQGSALLEKGAKMGSGEAELALAQLALRKDDLSSYAEHLNRALELGNCDAIEELSRAYRMGYGVEQDITKANEYYNDYLREQSQTWKNLIGSYLK